MKQTINLTPSNPSFYETIADVAYIAGVRRYYSGDSRADMQTFIHIAKQFEEKFKVDWEETDLLYMEEIEKFANNYLTNLEAEQVTVPFKKLFPSFINFYNEHPDLINNDKIIDTEIQPLRAWFDEGTSFDNNGAHIMYEVDEDDISVWTVYIKTDIKGMDINPNIAIADFEDKKTAIEFEKLLRSLLKLK